MKKIAILLIGFMIFSSCKDQATNASADHDHTSVIELDSGEKWKVNDEMKPFIEQSRAMVESFAGSNINEHQDLAKKLKAENEKLIQSCTMKGKAHDELHKWLHPHLELVEDLESETDPEAAVEIVNSLKDSFTIFDTYFR